MYLQDTSSSISIAQRQIAFVSNFNTTLTGSSSLNFALICLPWEWKNVHTVKIFFVFNFVYVLLEFGLELIGARFARG